MAKKSKKKGNGKFLGPGRLWLLLGLVAIVVLAALFAFMPYTGGDSQWLRFRTGSLSTTAVRDTLCNKLGSSMGMRTYTLWRAMGGDTLRVRGAFRVERGTTPVSLARRLAKGRQTPVNLTFNNARTLDDLAAKVASQMDFTPEAFLAAADSVLRPKGFTREEYPAMFMPDTYNVYATAAAADVVKKLVDTRDKFWTAERISAAEKQGLTAIEAATLASIVEEETSKRAEHPTIARLYLNRLHKGMRLQADPTVKFATGNFAARRITGDMLRVSSPYNTYLNAGLPPGPIRIADARTIETVLHPADNDYLYMCANYDFSGTHLFAKDYETHKRNARLYQQALDKRGIKN
ncbi:MAG: endolytic transglycosylase MltG [Muribaculaceae bacterium]|nr:endolytic transglycosylase MltG [Muribaculaceae bacterium]